MRGLSQYLILSYFTVDQVYVYLIGDPKLGQLGTVSPTDSRLRPSQAPTYSPPPTDQQTAYTPAGNLESDNFTAYDSFEGFILHLSQNPATTPPSSSRGTPRHPSEPLSPHYPRLPHDTRHSTSSRIQPLPLHPTPSPEPKENRYKVRGRPPNT